jgi:hypothetical protein
LNADTGTRIVVQYSGFPAGATLIVPTVVAGSDATQPTAGGDLGVTASGGKYTPGSNSSLLLSLVPNTDANGAGGTPAYLPGLPGSGTVTFDSMSEVTLTNGSGIAVYEVVDANDSIQESAQFPTFLDRALRQRTSTTTRKTYRSVRFLPSRRPPPPIPFLASSRSFRRPIAPSSAIATPVLPALSVPETSLNYTAQVGGVTTTNYVQVQNSAGGFLQWTASVNYTNGSGWLDCVAHVGTKRRDHSHRRGSGDARAGYLPGHAHVNAGPLAGTRNVAISFVITAPTIQPPSIQSAVNAATFAAGPLAPGSIATLFGGSQFAGQTVSVTFNGLPGQVLFSNATQINLVVPAGLGGTAPRRK